MDRVDIFNGSNFEEMSFIEKLALLFKSKKQKKNFNKKEMSAGEAQINDEAEDTEKSTEKGIFDDIGDCAGVDVFDDTFIDSPFGSMDDLPFAIMEDGYGIKPTVGYIAEKQEGINEENNKAQKIRKVYGFSLIDFSGSNGLAKEDIEFEYMETKCKLNITKEVGLFGDVSESELWTVFSHPEKYYFTDGEDGRCPCDCVYVLDKRSMKLFDCYDGIKEKIKSIEKFMKLSLCHKRFILKMSERTCKNEIVSEGENTVFSPIRDFSTLKMMYKMCKNTYTPDVRIYIEDLISQIDGCGSMTDKVNLINQLGFLVGIDTDPKKHHTKTYNQIMDILDKHVYGMKELKESIAEFIISMQHSGVNNFRMLLTGSPGVGKTSVCKAISECLDVVLLQIDCSGVDAITLGGLIKSYTGAKAGKILDSYRMVGSSDNLVCFEELDKINVANANSGDPYGVLAKPFGPQKQLFDEYLGADIDVSQTKFIATVNDKDKLPGYILNRFKNNVFHIPDYTVSQKVEVSKHYLIPKCFKAYKINEGEIVFTDEALSLIAEKYCSDGGMRIMEGHLETLIQKVITGWYRGIIEKNTVIDGEFVRKSLKASQNVTKERKIGYVCNTNKGE